MNKRVLDTRAGGIFIDTATTRLGVTPHRVMLNLAFEVSKAIFGGHWVGGTVSLSEAALEFHANRVNRRVFRDENLDIEIPLKDVISVRTDPAFGLGMRVVSVETPKSTLKIKCANAESFAENISAAAGT